MIYHFTCVQEQSEAPQMQPFWTCPDEGFDGWNSKACFYWHDNHWKIKDFYFIILLGKASLFV